MTMRPLALAIAATMAAGAAFGQGAAKRPAATTKSAMTDTLTTAEKKMLDDLTRHDAKAFFAVIAPGSWSVDEMGWSSIDDFRKSWDQLKVESSQTSEMKVVPIDAASGIVTYKLDQKGSYNGQPFPPTTYASTVWVNRGGKWMAIFHQESAASPKK